MADVGLASETVRVGIGAGIVGYFTDGDDAGHAGRDLVERNAMNVRVEPIQARRMVRRDLDFVVRRVIPHVGVDVRSWVGLAVRRIERQYKDIIAIARME